MYSLTLNDVLELHSRVGEQSGGAVVADLMHNVSVKWWIAGGWAIELFVGRSVRGHSDLEVGCFRSDFEHVIAQLPGWELMVACKGRLEPFCAASLAQPGIFSIWCRPTGSAYWATEILVEDRDDTDWISRRDTRIRRPVAQVMAQSEGGPPYFCPEVQLLYKSKSPRCLASLEGKGMAR